MWSTDMKSLEVARAARATLCAMFNHSPSSFTLLMRSLNKREEVRNESRNLPMHYVESEIYLSCCDCLSVFISEGTIVGLKMSYNLRTKKNNHLLLKYMKMIGNRDLTTYVVWSDCVARQNNGVFFSSPGTCIYLEETFFSNIKKVYKRSINANFRNVPSARLTLYSTKLSTKFKMFRKKIFFGTKVTSEAFLSISQNLNVTRLLGGTQTKLWICCQNFDLSRSFERFLGLVHGFAVL